MASLVDDGTGYDRTKYIGAPPPRNAPPRETLTAKDLERMAAYERGELPAYKYNPDGYPKSIGEYLSSTGGQVELGLAVLPLGRLAAPVKAAAPAVKGALRRSASKGFLATVAKEAKRIEALMSKTLARPTPSSPAGLDRVVSRVPLETAGKHAGSAAPATPAEYLTRYKRVDIPNSVTSEGVPVEVRTLPGRPEGVKVYRATPAPDGYVEVKVPPRLPVSDAEATEALSRAASMPVQSSVHLGSPAARAGRMVKKAAAMSPGAPYTGHVPPVPGWATTIAKTGVAGAVVMSPITALVAYNRAVDRERKLNAEQERRKDALKSADLSLAKFMSVTNDPERVKKEVMGLGQTNDYARLGTYNKFMTELAANLVTRFGAEFGVKTLDEQVKRYVGMYNELKQAVDSADVGFAKNATDYLARLGLPVDSRMMEARLMQEAYRHQAAVSQAMEEAARKEGNDGSAE